MNIVIDQGNTDTKLAIFNGRKLIQQKRFDSAANADIHHWLSAQTDETSSGIISSVTHQPLAFGGRSLIELSAKTPVPLKNGYLSPQTLGNDRLANAVAAWAKNPRKNSLVIDIGTCIKYDLVSSQGEYIGGNISPGLNMRFKALHEQTSRLPLVKSSEKRIEYGVDTETSMIEGVQRGVEHEIRGFIEQYSRRFEGLTIFMTGGDMKSFELAFKNSIFADPDLTLFGLNEILIYNLNA